MNKRSLAASLLLMMAFAAASAAQTNTFTYQGHLADNGGPANGTYSMKFAVYDQLAPGGGLWGILNNVAVTVVNGTFSVNLNFSPAPTFVSGQDRYLEISVQRQGDPGFTTLTPRQQIMSAPYAIRSLSAASADTATSAVTATTATNNVLKSGDSMSGSLSIGGSLTTSGNISTTGSGTITSAGALTVSGGGANITGNTVVNGTVTATPSGFLFAHSTTSNQGISTSNVYRDVNFETIDTLNGWGQFGFAIFGPQQTALYRVQYVASALTNSAGFVAIRATNNGIEIPGSAIGVSSSGTSYVLLSQSFIFSATALDQLKIQVVSNTSTVSLISPGVTGNQPPGITLTVVRLF